jgi:hypothetical protein
MTFTCAAAGVTRFILSGGIPVLFLPLFGHLKVPPIGK